MNASQLRDRLLGKHRSYARVFTAADGKLTPDGEAVMRDLSKFCCANQPTVRMRPDGGGIDPLAMALAEGRREVFNRMMGFIHLDHRTIQKLSENVDD